MNDTNLSILTAVINAFTLVGFKYAKNYSYNVSKMNFQTEEKVLIYTITVHIVIRKIRTKIV